MSETTSTSDSTTGPITTDAPTVVHERAVDRHDRRGKLHVVAAWVGIVAGTVFVVAVIFFSGFALGASMGGGHHGGHHQRDGGGQMEHRGDGPRRERPGGSGDFGPGFQGGPGGAGGFGPGAQGGGQGPAAVPPTPPGR